ncbi:MAG: phosphoadenylyl-sulfate reductase [Francisellaceae bacterium]|jgi:phosphoadenosine phosphosulfate reductase|nr:phosphoadenylyl-sulfate reductase [Francisellaceae bacterium]MBT6208199.1 phosphoadenylyl-sulfate reductase [Francisellaceae bacterium]MBT6538738.1 phosphoadenylyl-sulfate reductase [Francisellaceae bacterium]
MADIEEDIENYKNELVNATPAEIFKFAYDKYAERDILISFSGAEDVVLVDIACKLGLKPKVMSLDTGRLFPETLKYIETIRSTYDIELEVLYPDAEELEKFVKEKGLYSFYADGHKGCCGVRKLNPLKKRLAKADAWITGIRQDQGVTRDGINAVEIDKMFSGDPDKPLIKFNPLKGWTSVEVWSYIKENNVPYNPLHKKGFISIGCEPCTRATHPGQHEREGRWWWESAESKECGLHGNK